MAQTKPILINGTNYSYGDIQLVLFGTPVIGITKINYRVRQKKENNYGAGYEPISRGRGQKEYDGTITLYYDEVKAIINSQPATQNRSILAIPPFPVTVIFANENTPYTTDKLMNVEFTEDPFTSSQNDTKITVDIPFIFAGIAK